MYAAPAFDKVGVIVKPQDTHLGCFHIYMAFSPKNYEYPIVSFAKNMSGKRKMNYGVINYAISFYFTSLSITMKIFK